MSLRESRPATRGPLIDDGFDRFEIIRQNFEALGEAGERADSTRGDGAFAEGSFDSLRELGRVSARQHDERSGAIHPQASTDADADCRMRIHHQSRLLVYLANDLPGAVVVETVGVNSSRNASSTGSGSST